MDRMGFNSISSFNGLFNEQQKDRPLNGAKDKLKSIKGEQTLMDVIGLFRPIRQLLADVKSYILFERLL